MSPQAPTRQHHFQFQYNASLRGVTAAQAHLPNPIPRAARAPNWGARQDCFCTGKPGRHFQIVRSVPSSAIRRPDSSKFLCQKPATTPCPSPDWPSSFLIHIDRSLASILFAALVMYPYRAAEAKMAGVDRSICHRPESPPVL
jgi:hypothetical protein